MRETETHRETEMARESGRKSTSNDQHLFMAKPFVIKLLWSSCLNNYDRPPKLQTGAEQVKLKSQAR